MNSPQCCAAWPATCFTYASWLPGVSVTSCGLPSVSSQVAARANSESSEMFTRSPVSAMWSGLLRMHVAHDGIEHVAMMMAMPLAVPVDQPEPALVHQLANVRRFDRSDVRIGKMREGEHGGRYSVEVRACDSLPLKGEGRGGGLQATPTRHASRVDLPLAGGGEEAATRLRSRQKSRRPRGGAVRRQAWEGGLSPAILKSGTSAPAPLRYKGRSDRQPGSNGKPACGVNREMRRRSMAVTGLLCTAKIGFCRPSNNWNKVGSAMHLGMCIVRIR